MEYLVGFSAALLYVLCSLTGTLSRPLDQQDQAEILKQKQAILLKVIEDMKELVVSSFHFSHWYSL